MLVVRKRAFKEARVVAEGHDAAQLGEGEVLLRVDKFALTSNNITYAVFGEAPGMSYFAFYPPRDDPDVWGCVPVWGVCTVLESNHPSVEAGRRVYGFVPMARTVVLKPTQVSAQVFVDGSSHRQSLAAVYNTYNTLGHRDDKAEGVMMVLRPLFATSFLIDAFLHDKANFGAQCVVVGSASSKTSIALAYLLHKRGVEVVGLTSPSNLAFVQSLGIYTTALAYADATALPPSTPTVFVDMSGNRTVLAALHTHLASNLKYSCLVGATHWENNTAKGKGGAGKGEGEAPSLPGPKPEMFFAPAHVAQRTREWGDKGFRERLAGAWDAFVGFAQGWMEFEEVWGEDGVARVYEALVAGRVDPAKATVVSMHDRASL